MAKKKQVEEQDSKRDPQDVLEETMMELVFSEPFYANLMLNMKRMFTTDIPTLGVMPPGTEMSGDQIALIVNPYFFCSLTLKERVEVLKHECHHVIMNHFVRFRDLEPQIYDEKNPKTIRNKVEDAMNASTLNKAADYAINEYLPNLPKNFKIFDKDGNPLTHGEEMPDPKDPTKKIANPNAGKAIQTGCLLVDELKKQIKGVKNRQNTEYYYDILCEENEKNPQGDQGQGMVLDDHSMWHQGNASEEEITAKVKEVVNKAVEQTDQRAIGNLPADVQAAIEALNHVPKDWKQELQRFVARQIEILVESTRKRRNRRYGILYPGLQKLPVMHLAVAIDTSGSVNDEELAQFLAEIDRIHKLNVKVTVIECDADVQAVYDFDPRKKIEIKGRGGTRFAPVFKHIKDNKLDVDGLIYLTDGGCWESSADIEKPRYPVMWAVLKNYANNFNWSWGSKTEIEVTKKVRR